jgi:hypothetical protein
MPFFWFFSLGFSVIDTLLQNSICAISVIRMVVLSRLNFNDISYDMLDSVFWTVTEPALVIINACIPTLRPLISLVFTNRSWNRSKPTNTPVGTHGSRGALQTIGGSTLKSGHNFQRMPDEYPLTDRRHVEHTLKVTADPETSTDGGSEHRLTTSPKLVAFGRKANQVTKSTKKISNLEDGVVSVKKEWSVDHKSNMGQ